MAQACPPGTQEVEEGGWQVSGFCTVAVLKQIRPMDVSRKRNGNSEGSSEFYSETNIHYIILYNTYKYKII